MSLQQLAQRVDALPLVLLAENHSDTRELYGAYLRHAGCTVEEADDGAVALARAIAIHPTIIITDTALPTIDGYALCALLRQDVATRATPIVALTADAAATRTGRATRAGADVVLVTPCGPDVLFTEMNRLIEKNKALRDRGTELVQVVDERVAALDHAIQESRNHRKRVMLSRAHQRRSTTTPPQPPPALRCPRCDQPLRYQRSHVGGVSALHAEQWDYFECPGGCGAYQYRQRTRTVRPV